jgi:hypothetical protein
VDTHAEFPAEGDLREELCQFPPAGDVDRDPLNLDPTAR